MLTRTDLSVGCVHDLFVAVIPTMVQRTASC
jgi:hypothetical protein